MTYDKSLEKTQLAYFSRKCCFAPGCGAHCVAIHHRRTARSAVSVAARMPLMHMLMHRGHGKHNSDNRPH